MFMLHAYMVYMRCLLFTFKCMFLVLVYIAIWFIYKCHLVKSGNKIMRIFPIIQKLIAFILFSNGWCFGCNEI
uniref:Uncharacterized protein n=1 Tax=Arundo donax TaxID=35708 RepID=A0A0A9BFS5_ARUDO